MLAVRRSQLAVIVALLAFTLLPPSKLHSTLAQEVERSSQDGNFDINSEEREHAGAADGFLNDEDPLAVGKSCGCSHSHPEDGNPENPFEEFGSKKKPFIHTCSHQPMGFSINDLQQHAVKLRELRRKIASVELKPSYFLVLLVMVFLASSKLRKMAVTWGGVISICTWYAFRRAIKSKESSTKKKKDGAKYIKTPSSVTGKDVSNAADGKHQSSDGGNDDKVEVEGKGSAVATPPPSPSPSRKMSSVKKLLSSVKKKMKKKKSSDE